MNQFLETAKELLFEITFAIGAIAILFILIFFLILGVRWMLWYLSADRKKIDRQINFEDEYEDLDEVQDIMMNHFVKQEPWTTN